MTKGDTNVKALVEHALRSVGRPSASPGARPSVSAAPMVALVNAIIDEAIRLRASDIHIEPFEGAMRVRLRIDGVLRGIYGPLPEGIMDALISRIKVMARVSTTERRVPQDGRITYEGAGATIDIRVSTMPVMNGEAVVLRLLSGARKLLRLDELDFSASNKKLFESWSRSPSGLLLNVGPVNSGKTTTLYAALSGLNTPDKNIITIEDPVEYYLPGVNQIQVNVAAGLTFAAGLRSILRQDPDVCMVGEIRDEETAEIAVRAALTGRLLFSTLHTGSAPGAIFRLLDMGIKPYLLSASLLGIMAQRLVRRLCPACRERYEAESGEDLSLLAVRGIGSAPLYRAGGCKLCHGSGYSGRIAVHELLPVSDTIRRAILSTRDISEMEQIARREGMVPLLHDGIAKALDGLTSTDEIRRVIYGSF